MGKTFLVDFSSPQRGDGKEILKNHMSVLWGQFQYSVGVVLSISGGGIIIWQAF